jgi:hypothetical protein
MTYLNFKNEITKFPNLYNKKKDDNSSSRIYQSNNAEEKWAENVSFRQNSSLNNQMMVRQVNL